MAGLSFAFTGEQEQFRQAVARFAERRLAPGYRERSGQDVYPMALHAEMAALGVLGIGLPEEFGGTGRDDRRHRDRRLRPDRAGGGFGRGRAADHGHPGAGRLAPVGGEELAGVSAFLVETDRPGVSVDRFHDMGQLPIGRGSLYLLTHGHYGWSDELPFQQRFRDVFGYQIGDGTAQIQKQVIASRLIGPEARGR